MNRFILIFVLHPQTQLEIAYNPIGPEGAKALSEVLKFHGNVKNLKLGWCKVKDVTGRLYKS